jgi:hypothetical protein
LGERLKTWLKNRTSILKMASVISAFGIIPLLSGHELVKEEFTDSSQLRMVKKRACQAVKK